MHSFDEGHARMAMHCILNYFVNERKDFSIEEFNDWMTLSGTGKVYKHIRMAHLTINPNHKGILFFIFFSF